MAEISIYKADETDFTHNGIVLKDTIYCEIEEELNGKYVLELKHPISDNNMHLHLKEENIIKADGQLFRIYSSIGNLGYIEVKARHIFYDLLHNFLEDVRPTDMNGTNALNHILDNTQYEHSFRGVSDVGTINTQYYIRKNPVEAILGSDSLSTRWGGELVRDNFTIKLLKSKGVNKGLQIAYGKNLLGLEVEKDMDSVATRIMPVGNDGLLLPEKYIDSPLIDNYNQPYIKKVEIDIGVEEATDDKEGVTQEEAFDIMRQKVSDLYEFDKVDIPYVNIKADLALLENTEEYKDLKHLVNVELGDIVSCTDNPLNIEFEAKVIRVKKDVLSNKNVEVELGQFKKGLSDTIKDILEDVKQEIEINKSDLEKAVENATNLITSALGGYVVKRNGEILIMDKEDPNTATKIWRWNLNGLAYSGNGVNGPYELAMTMDGSIVADFITTGVLNASLIKTGILKSQVGNIWINMENGYFKLGDITYNEQGFNIRLGGKPIEDYIKDQVPKLDLEGTLVDVQDMIDNAIAEGVLNQAEAAAIGKYIKILEKEQMQFNKEFTDLYAEITLPTEYKDDLLEAHTNRLLPDFNYLIYIINQAIASGETTPMQKEEVDSAFDIYTASLINFNNEVDRGWAKIKELEDARVASGIDDRFSTFDLTLEGLRATVGDFDTIVDGETRTISSAIGALELTSEGFMTRFDNTEQIIDGLGKSVATNASNLQQTATNIRSEVAQSVTGLNRSISDAKRDAINHANDKNDELKDAINADIASIDLDSGYVESLKALKATIRGQKDEIEGRYIIVYNDENLLSTYKTQLKEKFDMVMERYDLAVDQINIMIQMDKLTETDKSQLINRLDNFTNSFPDFNNANRLALRQLDNTLVSKIAAIDTKADEIDIRVGKKVGMEEVISSINVRDSRINIATENLNLSGDLNLRGKFTNYDSVSGEKAVEISDSKIDFYDYDGSTRRTPVGVLFSSRSGGETTRVGTAFNSEANASISIGYAVGTRYSDYMTFNKDGNTNGYPITAREPMALVEDARIFGDKRLRLGSGSNLYEVGAKLIIRGHDNNGFQLGSALAGQIIDWNPSTIGTYPIALRKSTAVLGYFKASNNALFESNLSVTGSKNSLQNTQNYGDRLINAYETAEYYFGDIGSGAINEDGECLIYIDDIFAETINTNINYHVFTQKYNGKITNIDRQKNYFIVYGESGTEFSWEIKAKRKGYEHVRLEVPQDEFEVNVEPSSIENDNYSILSAVSERNKELNEILNGVLDFSLVDELLI